MSIDNERRSHYLEASQQLHEAIVAGCESRGLFTGTDEYVVAEYARGIVETILCDDPLEPGLLEAAHEYERNLWADRQETLI